jgi:hypothetical protein
MDKNGDLFRESPAGQVELGRSDQALCTTPLNPCRASHDIVKSAADRQTPTMAREGPIAFILSNDDSRRPVGTFLLF